MLKGQCITFSNCGLISVGEFKEKWDIGYISFQFQCDNVNCNTFGPIVFLIAVSRQIAEGSRSHIVYGGILQHHWIVIQGSWSAREAPV